MSREIYFRPVRCNPFPQGFVFDSRRVPDPVATARGSDTASKRWAKEKTYCGHDELELMTRKQ
jgi:hypothetical protein